MTIFNIPKKNCFLIMTLVLTTLNVVSAKPTKTKTPNTIKKELPIRFSEKLMEKFKQVIDEETEDRAFPNFKDFYLKVRLYEDNIQTLGDHNRRDLPNCTLLVSRRFNTFIPLRSFVLYHNDSRWAPKTWTTKRPGNFRTLIYNLSFDTLASTNDGAIEVDCFNRSLDTPEAAQTFVQKVLGKIESGDLDLPENSVQWY